MTCLQTLPRRSWLLPATAQCAVVNGTFSYNLSLVKTLSELYNIQCELSLLQFQKQFHCVISRQCMTAPLISLLPLRLNGTLLRSVCRHVRVGKFMQRSVHELWFPELECPCAGCSCGKCFVIYNHVSQFNVHYYYFIHGCVCMHM